MKIARNRDQERAKIGQNRGLSPPHLPFARPRAKQKNKKLTYKPNSLSKESRLHLAYATSPLNHLVPPGGRVRSCEGLQKIYPQNLKKKTK